MFPTVPTCMFINHVHKNVLHSRQPLILLLFTQFEWTVVFEWIYISFIFKFIFEILVLTNHISKRFKLANHVWLSASQSLRNVERTSRTTSACNDALSELYPLFARLKALQEGIPWETEHFKVMGKKLRVLKSRLRRSESWFKLERKWSSDQWRLRSALNCRLLTWS